MTTTILHLSLIDGIGPAAITKILQNLSLQHINRLYSFKQSDFITLCGFSEAIAQKLVIGLSDKKMVEQELLLAQKNEITIVTFIDDAYPALLKHIYLPPPVLYTQGYLKNSKSLAVVGSRQAQSYAQRAISLLVPPLVENGWTIVSGGAIGADSFAHRQTLKTGGTTVVVLGSGLLNRYPLQNNDLFDAIVETGGVLVSPFALHQQPLPGNFPARNRIIAGLSQGCLVVQAAEKSGARITATYALEQGKDVFVVPGPLDDPLSAGGHALIQQGAKLVTSASDILDEFNEVVTSVVHTQKSDVAEIKSLRSAPIITKQDPEDAFLVLCRIPISLEDLADQTNLSLSELQVKLFDLQLDGRIVQNFAGLWQRC